MGKQAFTQARKELKEAMQEQFQPDAFAQLENAWKSNPEVRTEVLQQARQFSTDANYPTPAQLKQLAQMLVGETMSMPPAVDPPPAPAPTPDSTPDTEPPVVST